MAQLSRLCLFIDWRIIRRPNNTTSVEKMAMTKTASIKWRSEPEQHDYPAAESYLSLTLGRQAAKNAVTKLKRAKISRIAAKDIFRASKLSLLGVSNIHVEKDRAKISQHEQLSPLLLVRDKKKWGSGYR